MPASISCTAVLATCGTQRARQIKSDERQETRASGEMPSYVARNAGWPMHLNTYPTIPSQVWRLRPVSIFEHTFSWPANKGT